MSGTGAVHDGELRAIGAEVLRLTRDVEERERIAGRRAAAALALVYDPDTLASVCAGRPVLARNCDPEALRCALRGGPLPDALAYIEIGGAHLDALAEAMPLRPRKPATRRGSR